MNNNYQTIIPVFFSCDENYIPYLTVTIQSIIENKTKKDNSTKYELYILNDGISYENRKQLFSMQRADVQIHFVYVNEKISDIIDKLDHVRDYYTKAIFFRLFIASLFPKYSKAIYLDCDIVVLEDLKNLYNLDLGSNIVAAAVDEVVCGNEDFKVYVKDAIGVKDDKYFNSGVLVINLDEYRKARIEEKFLNILLKYDFESVAPDQDYLNYLCRDRVLYLDKSWNKMPVGDGYKGDLNLIHYNMFMKPWRYDIEYDEYFWLYAKHTPYYQYLKDVKAAYSEEKKLNDYQGVSRMVKMAYRIINGENFVSVYDSGKDNYE